MIDTGPDILVAEPADAAPELFGEEARAQARRLSLPLDAYLIDVGRRDEGEVLGEVCQRLSLRYLDRSCVSPERVSPSFLESFPMELARGAGLVAVLEPGQAEPTLVMSRPLDLATGHEAVRCLGPCRLAAAPKDLVLATLNQALDRQGRMADGLVPSSDVEAEEQGLLAEIERLGPSDDLLDLANKAPVVRLLNTVLHQALRMRASDVHLHPEEGQLLIRYRIDGIMHTKLTVPKSVQAPLASRVKVMANLDIAERRLPQDGRTTVTLGSRQVDVRVSVVPTADDERVVMRLLDKGARLYRLEDLGMPPATFALFEQLIRRSHGIVLVTGPTGSGKTTTLYAALQRIDAAKCNIITIEDPIEYRLQGINQIQVSDRKGMTFASALRSVLRQDPDVIMVGEIRDAETARMAIQSSLTGHLVFSTLHTNDAAGAATRLVDIGVEPYLVASSVAGILAQRLVRRICPHCAHDVEPNRGELLQLGLRPQELPASVRVGAGCDECLGAGYLDRVGIYELLPLSPVLGEMITARAPAGRLKEQALREGLVTLRRDGAAKVLQGLTTAEEVLRVTQADAPVEAG